MTNPIELIREAHHKAQARVIKLRASLELAERELEENATALRVLERLTGTPPPFEGSAPTGETGEIILRYVGLGPKNARSPKEIIVALEADGHSFGADLVRTQLWRMNRRGILNKGEGKYWLPDEEPRFNVPAHLPDEEAQDRFGHEAELEGPEKTEQHPYGRGEIAGSSPAMPAPVSSGAFGSDLDDDVPF